MIEARGTEEEDKCSLVVWKIWGECCVEEVLGTESGLCRYFSGAIAIGRMARYLPLFGARAG